MSGFWLVGESPNRATVGQPDLWLVPDDSGLMHSANRLLALTGWTLDQYLGVFEHRTNLWHWPMRLWANDGRKHARQIAMQSTHDDGVVILGSKAAEMFDLDDELPFTWVGRYAVIPHPSGRCRYWNEPGARETAREFFGDLLDRHQKAHAGASANRGN